jgi:hypothetical protein
VHAAGLAAAGSVDSDDHLLTVIGDALAQFRLTRSCSSRCPMQQSHWHLEDLAEKVEGRHGKPLRELVRTTRETGLGLM